MAAQIIPPPRPFWTLRSDGIAIRLLTFALLVIAITFVFDLINHWLGLFDAASKNFPGKVLLVLEFNLLPYVLAYWLLVRVVEARHVEELAARKLLPGLFGGFLAGCVLMLVVAVLLWLASCYRIDGVNPAAPWFGPLFIIGVIPGVGEEIISRGLIYRIVEERFGSWIALIVSALLFGFLHAWNPNATLWSCLAIAIEAGLLFGIVYTITRSLYICMGLHAAWNFMEGPVLGTPVSGISVHGLLASTLHGPTWLSGGPFGIEASALTVVLLGAASVMLIVHAQRHGLILPPRRDNIRTPTNASLAASSTLH